MRIKYSRSWRMFRHNAVCLCQNATEMIEQHDKKLARYCSKNNSMEDNGCLGE